MTAHVSQCEAVCATHCLLLCCRSLSGDYYLTRSIYGDFAIQVRQYECQPNMACFSGARILYGDTVINFGYQNLYVPAAKCVCGSAPSPYHLAPFLAHRVDVALAAKCMRAC